jgi:hypothetical protein
MKSQLTVKVWSLVHSSRLLLTLVVAGLIASIPARAQDSFRVDARHSIARLFLGSGQNVLEIGLARVSGQVVFDSDDPADPSVSLKIAPDDGPRSEYAEMSFTSERSAMTVDGKLVVTGTLSVTRVERSVAMEPNEAYAGPQFGDPVVHTDTHAVTLVFSDPHKQSSHDGAMELSGTTSVSRENFPQFVDAVTAGDWPTTLVNDEKCEQPSTIGDDYSGAICTGDVIATVSNPAVITGSAGEEDYSGYRPAVTPDRKQATMALDLRLEGLPSRAGVGVTPSQTTK